MKKIFSIALIVASGFGFFQVWQGVQVMLASPEGLAWHAGVMAIFIASLTSLLSGIYLYRRKSTRQMIN